MRQAEYARRAPPRAPRRCWTGGNGPWRPPADISSIPTREGGRSLAIILDGLGRRVVGWAMAAHLPTALVLAALRLALQHRRPPAGRIHHGERGGQYPSLAVGQHPRAGGLVPPTGSGGACDD